MGFKEFIDKYNIRLSDESRQICRDGIFEMSQSKDPLHDDIHVLGIIGLLDQFLQNSDEVRQHDINFDVLLPSVCWHDVWKSYRSQTTNLLKFKFEQQWDGAGSAGVFKKYVRKNKVSPVLAKEIEYAIFHHGGMFRKWKKRKDHSEACILDDLDLLDSWNEKRLRCVAERYLNENNKFYNLKMIPVADWLLRKWSRETGDYYFKWCNEEFQRRRDCVLRWGREIIKANKK